MYTIGDVLVGFCLVSSPSYLYFYLLPRLSFTRLHYYYTRRDWQTFVLSPSHLNYLCSHSSLYSDYINEIVMLRPSPSPSLSSHLTQTISVLDGKHSSLYIRLDIFSFTKISALYITLYICRQCNAANAVNWMNMKAWVLPEQERDLYGKSGPSWEIFTIYVKRTLSALSVMQKWCCVD